MKIPISIDCSILMYSTVQYSTAQHSTAQHSTAQHSTAQHSTAQHSTAQHSTAQHSTAQHNTVQYSTVQYSTVQYSTGLHTKVGNTPLQLLFCLLAYKQITLGYFSNLRLSLLPGGHSITKHTGGLARRSQSKPPKYLSKSSNIKNC